MALGLNKLGRFFNIDGLNIATASTNSNCTRYNQRDDLLLFGFPENTTVGACFTRNAFAAAPVQLAKQHLAGRLAPKFWLINAGNANAATGELGMANATKLCSYIANRFECENSQVVPFSTGVIGEQLPVDQEPNPYSDSLAKINLAPATDASWHKAASAIMTTDTVAKGISLQVPVGNSHFVINGITKGSGMICPNMATMLGFIVTDLKISQPLLQHTLSKCLDTSFHAISVDGDTSTNDAVAIAATGTTSLESVDDTPKLAEMFSEHLQDACNSLAQMIVRDGEGITKLVAIEVTHARNTYEAKSVAQSIAHSPLVKTAMFASDPNWGRIACAIGNAQLNRLDPARVAIWIDDLCIMRGGTKDKQYTEAKGKQYFAKSEIWLKIELGMGDASFNFYTTDLSHQYVTINSDYRS